MTTKVQPLDVSSEMVRIEIDLRSTKCDIEHTRETIKGFDEKIAEMAKRRDRHVKYLGGLEERLEVIAERKKAYQQRVQTSATTKGA